jgi:hypothetical protein
MQEQGMTGFSWRDLRILFRAALRSLKTGRSRKALRMHIGWSIFFSR